VLRLRGTTPSGDVRRQTASLTLVIEAEGNTGLDQAIGSAAAPVETLSGLVERVTYHNAENGFCVLRVKARGQRDLGSVKNLGRYAASGIA